MSEWSGTGRRLEAAAGRGSDPLTPNPQPSTSESFKSSQRWNPERIRALAIYCSDGRWGEAFDEFCHVGLGLPRYDRFAVPGGPLWLTLRHSTLLTPYTAARDQIHFLVQAHGLERIVLISHYGCAYYAELLGQEPDACLPAQEEDLRTAAGTLRGWFAGMQVDCFMAMRSGEALSFRPIEG
jgi:hypothetical protein